MLDATRIGTAIRSLRERRGLSIRQACSQVEKKTGTRIQPSTVSRWETGQQLPMVDTLSSFLQGLDADFSDFQAAVEAEGGDPAGSVLSELRRVTERLEAVADRLEGSTTGS